MATRTPNQEKALKWFCQENDLKPQLSAHPIYYFKDSKGEEQKHNIMHIVADWERMRESKTKKPRA